MTPQLAQAKKRMLELMARIPRGRLATHVQLSHALNIDRRQIAALLLQLDDAERAGVPWHRVVADGGAIGRHPHREVQMALLRADGVPVAPAGIAQELGERQIESFDGVIQPIEPPPPEQARSRARGTKASPQSTVGGARKA